MLSLTDFFTKPRMRQLIFKTLKSILGKTVFAFPNLSSKRGIGHLFLGFVDIFRQVSFTFLDIFTQPDTMEIMLDLLNLFCQAMLASTNFLAQLST